MKQAKHVIILQGSRLQAVIFERNVKHLKIWRSDWSVEGSVKNDIGFLFASDGDGLKKW